MNDDETSIGSDSLQYQSNPWILMILKPRVAIRSVLQEHPKFGFWILASGYSIAFSFHTANFYSWGLSHSFFSIFLPLFLLSPIWGALIFYLDGWILSFTASWFGQPKASFLQLRTAVAWSKVPSIFSLTMWILLSISDSGRVFIHYASNASLVIIVFISLILNLWSFGLLVQSVRELQSFSLLRAFNNVLISYIFSFFFYLLSLIVGRYIYLLLF